MKKNENWVMLYSEIPVILDNSGAMDTTVLSHYLHLPERNCETGIYLYLVKVTDDVPDYSTLEPFTHSSLIIDFGVYESRMEEKGPEEIWINIKRKNANFYTLKLHSYAEKDYGRGIIYLSLRSAISAMDGVEFLKILVGATHHWNIVCSENKINLTDRKCILGSSLKRCVEILEETAEREVYLYLVKGNKDVLDCSSLQPLLYNEIVADYCIGKDKSIARIEGLGVSILRQTENRYLITLNNAVQKDYLKGRGRYLVRPILPGEIEESQIIHDFKVDTFEHWRVLCSDKPLDLDSQDVISFLPVTHFSSYVTLPICENGMGQASYYLYMAREKDGCLDFQTILPVTAEFFDINYEDIDFAATGLEVSKIKDNYYLFRFDEEEREDYLFGCDIIYVMPKNLTLGKQVVLHHLEVHSCYDFDEEGDCGNEI